MNRYRYQLEAFVDKLRGRDPEHWFDAQDSITNLEWIEAVYKEVSSHRVSTTFQFVFSSFGASLLTFLSFTDRARFSPSIGCRGSVNGCDIGVKIGSINEYCCGCPDMR